MPDSDPTFPAVPEAEIVPPRRLHLSFVWIIPIVAAVAGLWIAVTRIMNQGPEITIVFASGDGLEANKTKVRYNGLEVGQLTAIKLADDHRQVVATARMSPKAKEFLVKDTRFWVVKPRISGLTVSGLGTLISGYYIGAQLGESRESARSFTALPSPPLTGDVPGRMFLLKTPELGSLAEGTPIYFRQLQAGQVVSYALDPAGQFLNVKVFVQSPYDQYVTPDTRFWHASGIDLSLSASGLHVQTESILSVLAGGIAFETPQEDSPRPPAATEASFNLFNNRAEAFRPPPCNPHEFVLVFKQSVRGLTLGAPVELGGVAIGEVTKISPQIDASSMEFTVPVTVCVDPMRYGVGFLNLPPPSSNSVPHQQVIDALVARGMRGQLKTGSLISGSLYVAVDFHPEAPPVSLDWSQNPVRLPTLPSQIETLEASANRLIASMDTTLSSVRGTLTNADLVLGQAGNLIASDSPLNAGLNHLLQQGGGAARSLRILADYLEQHPEALLRGKPSQAKP